MATLLVMSVALQPALADEPVCESQVIVEDTTLLFDGCLSVSTVNLALAALTPQTRRLVIRSHGGEVPASIRFARAVGERDLAVIVRGHCESSCANYLLPVGHPAAIETGSRVLFHGDVGLTIEGMGGLGRLPTTDQEMFGAVIEQEKRFYAEYPRAARGAELQRAVRSRGLQHLPNLGLECEGLEKSIWVPSASVLVDLGMIDYIDPVKAEMRTEDTVFAETRQLYFGSPLWNCTKAQ